MSNLYREPPHGWEGGRAGCGLVALEQGGEGLFAWVAVSVCPR